jgi:hypothetical protein
VAQGVAVNEGGQGLLVFQQQDQVKPPIMAAVVEGGAVGRPFVAVPAGRGASPVALRVNRRGDAALVWTEQPDERGGQPNFLVAVKPTGGAFGVGEELLAEADPYFGLTFGFGEAGHLVAVARRSNQEPVAAVRAPGGSWVGVDASEMSGVPAVIAVRDDGSAEVLSSALAGPQTIIRTFASSPGGGFRATEDVVVLPPGTRFSEGAVRPDGSTALLRTLGSQALVAVRAPASSFTASAPVSGTDRVGELARLALTDGGGVAVGWRTDERRPRARVVLGGPGAGFGRPFTAFRSDATADFQLVRNSRGDTLIAGGGLGVVDAAVVPRGGQLRRTRLARFPDGGPAIAGIGGDGRGVILWRRSRGDSASFIKRAVSPTGDGAATTVSVGGAFLPAFGERCSTRGRPAVLRTRDILVRRDGGDSVSFCHLASGTAYGAQSPVFAVNGPIVAQAVLRNPQRPAASTYLIVFDVRDDRRPVRPVALPDPAPEDTIGLGRLRVTRSGALGYTACTDPTAGERIFICRSRRREPRLHGQLDELAARARGSRERHRSALAATARRASQLAPRRPAPLGRAAMRTT